MKQALHDLVWESIQNRECSAAQILVAKTGRSIFSAHYGKSEAESCFDLASLTKPLATAWLSMLAVQAGLLKLDDLVSRFFKTKNLADVTVRQLLNHTSLLKDWQQFYPATIPEVVTDAVSRRDQILKKILHDKKSMLTKAPGSVVYSDLGYILLGAILDQVFAGELNQIFKEQVSGPLGIEASCFFLPVGKRRPVQVKKFVPTHICPVRKRLVQGEVMDLNCYFMGGVSGHAGLFANAQAIHQMLRELRAARLGKSKLIQQKTFLKFCIPQQKRDLSQRYFTLGFDTPTQPGSSAGRYFSKNSIGHLGFSGTSFWWDLDLDVWVILLTNRHVFGDGTPRGAFALRPAIHDVIMRHIDK